MADGQEMTLLGIDAISEINMARQRPGLPDGILGINGDLVSLIGTSNAVVAMEESTASSLDLKVADSFNLSTRCLTRRYLWRLRIASPKATPLARSCWLISLRLQGVLGRPGNVVTVSDLAG